MSSMWFVAVAVVLFAAGLGWWAARWATHQARHADDLLEPVAAQRNDLRRTSERLSATGERLDGHR